ncbi:MAG TPA: hypothetical protein VKN73_09435 [Desulfosalsimonadaceae bacterium]|nr:hypothetical protein [Desulfosalsimonadaceae bacterium]
MYLNQYNRQGGIEETAIDIAIKSGNVFNWRNGKAAEVFFVHTEKITCLALLYADRHQHYQSTGFIIFADGEKWHFSMDERDEPNIREKARTMTQRIARVYQGTMKYGIVDVYDPFCSKEI